MLKCVHHPITPQLGGEHVNLHPVKEEIGGPQWIFADCRYDIDPSGSGNIVTTYSGVSEFGKINVKAGTVKCIWTCVHELYKHFDYFILLAKKILY